MSASGSLVARQPRIASLVWEYGLAVLATLLGLGLRGLLDAELGPNSPYLPLVLAVIVAARYAGRGPALVCTALTTLGALYLFVEPRYSLLVSTRQAGFGLALYGLVGIVISLLIGHSRGLLHAALSSEQALRRRQQLIDLSHDAVITATSDRRITDWNAGAAALYGFRKEEVLGTVIHDLLHTHGVISVGEINSFMSRDGHWDGELHHTDRDGLRLDIESRQVLLRSPDGEPESVLEINRDITERKRAEGEARRAADQCRLALESGGMGTWSLDLASGLMTMDERCAAIFGIASQGPLHYTEVQSHIHPDDRAASVRLVEQARDEPTSRIVAWDRRFVWADDSVHWATSHALTVPPTEDNQAGRLVGVVIDATERRHAEERLRQRQKLESVGLLAGGIAHDFNNLLTVIMGNASVLLAAQPGLAAAESIVAAAKRAAYLTRQLLAYAGKGQFTTSLVDLSELVASSTDLLATFTPKRVAIDFKLARSLPRVEADPSQLQQILMNLVINAGEAMPSQPGRRIDVSTSAEQVAPGAVSNYSRSYDVVPGLFVCLEVRDNGMGMDEATLVRIFEPFFSTKFTGRGLGLAAVDGIVRSCKGFFEVQSQPGAGSTFRVFLPATSKQLVPEPAAVPVPDAQAKTSRRATILVVEDVEMVRKLAAETLRGSGFEVLEACHGADALDVLSKAQSLPAVALVDMEMPVMGGDELVPLLEQTYPSLKVVITSGYSAEDASQGFLSGSVVGFLQKPYTIAGLVTTITEALRTSLPVDPEATQNRP